MASDERLDGLTMAPKRYDLLWFSDGNVVLATDVYLFKVHKGILSLQSSVFKDMFELSDFGNSDAKGNCARTGDVQDTYDGLPLVTLVGDKGEDVVHLLRTVYEIRYHDYHSHKTPLHTMVALLLLSSKYNFEGIRTNVTIQISKSYPLGFHEYDSSDLRFLSMMGSLRENSCFALLTAAFKAEAQILLPTLYFECANKSTRIILSEVQRNATPYECIDTLLRGREKMVQAINEFIWRIPECVRAGIDDSGCLKVPPCLEKFRHVCLSDLSRTDFSDSKESEVIRRYLNPSCSQCLSFVRRAIKKMRGEIWNDAPSYFDCLDWEVLRGQLDELSDS